MPDVKTRSEIGPFYIGTNMFMIDVHLVIMMFSAASSCKIFCKKQKRRCTKKVTKDAAKTTLTSTTSIKFAIKSNQVHAPKDLLHNSQSLKVDTNPLQAQKVAKKRISRRPRLSVIVEETKQSTHSLAD